MIPFPSVNKNNWPSVGEIPTFSKSKPDGSVRPKISVVTPSYNQGQFIEETIRSVLLQGYSNLEFIIIDGGSTDVSIEIIKKYETWLAYWVSEPDRGQSHAINKAIKKASGDILLWLNSDDICLPGSLLLAAQAFCSNPGLKLAIGQARIINSQGEIIDELRSQFSSWEELATNPRNSVRQISTFFSKSLFDELGLVNENLHIAMDTELLVRFTQFHKPLILQDYLTAYRIHSEAKTYSQLLKGYAETDRVRPKYFLNRTMASKYYQRSSKNWLILSESKKFSIAERCTCLFRAFKNQQSIFFTREYWSSIKKIFTDSLKKSLTNDLKVGCWSDER
jgi:glycosyltransferase involved in cell wall biosynthesis